MDYCINSEPRAINYILHNLINENELEKVGLLLSQNNEKLGNLIQQNTTHLLDKTTILLNDVLPKSNENQFNFFKESISNFQKTISEDSEKILQSINKEAKFLYNKGEVDLSIYEPLPSEQKKKVNVKMVRILDLMIMQLSLLMIIKSQEGQGFLVQ